MTQGPAGPPPFGGPPQQPYGPPPGKPPGPHPASSPPAAQADSTAPVGPARLLALAAGGLGVLIYLLGFFGYGGVGDAYLLGGGLLTAASVLPKVGRVLLPGAIIVVVGALGLLQGIVAAGSPSAVVIVGLILAILQAAAAVGAYLMDAGLVNAPARRPTGGGGGWGPRQPGYGPQGYGPGPSGYGQGPGPIPGGPPPMFGPQPGAQPGWGPPQQPQPQQATEVVPRLSGGGPDADQREDTSTNSFAAQPATDRPADRPADETSVFNDGGMFAESKPGDEQSRPDSSDDGPPAPTTVIPIVTQDESDGRTQRTERSAPRSADSTSVFGDGGMFSESTPGRHTTESSSGEGRHEKPADPDWKSRKNVPPSEQTWFMPPDERPSN